MIAPATAAAQDRRPTPSAEHLWRTYPLQPKAQPGTPTPAATSRPASAPAAPATPGDDGAPIALLAVAGAALALAGTVALRRRGSLRAPARWARWAAPLLPAAAATASLSSQGPRSPRLTTLGTEATPGGEPAPEPPGDGARPPDPDRAWTAEVEWREEGGGSRFFVVARTEDGGESVPIASSAPLEWPPPNAAAVQRVSRATARLEAELLETGWTPLPPGSAWYAKRFAWAATADPADPEQATGRFKRQVGWPAGTEVLWRCEIRWQPGYVNSRFDAVAHEPGRRRRVTVCRSDTFKWLLMADPEVGAPEYADQVRRVAELLMDAGWEPAGRGKHWYELRFVWRRDGAPPAHIDSAPAEAGAMPNGADDAPD